MSEAADDGWSWADGVVGNAEIERVLDEALAPLLHEAYVALQDQLAPVVLRWANVRASHAAGLVANQAFNDLQDLLFDLRRGSGRSAARASRALYEHTVNFCEVTDNPDSAARYEAHAAVGLQLEARLAVGLPRMTGGDLRAMGHEMRKLARDSQQAYDQALVKYGQGFRSNWAKDNLYDRAVRHGLGDDYDAYRLLSAVLHGSAAGALGTLSSAYAGPVHRTGPALHLAVLAYHEGLRFFARFLAELGRRHPGVDVSALSVAVKALLDRWSAYREAVLETDRRLWPDQAPPRAVAVLAVYPNGVRWYYHERQLGYFLLADPPDGAQEHERRAREHLRSVGGVWADAERRPPTYGIAGLRVTPRAGARPVPEDALLVPRHL